jgi:hypothetical protein
MRAPSEGDPALNRGMTRQDGSPHPVANRFFHAWGAT